MREIHDLSFDIDRFLEDAARAKQQLDAERWREELRPRALRVFTTRTATLQWSRALLKLVVRELYPDDLFAELIGNLDRVPPRRWPSHSGIAGTKPGSRGLSDPSTSLGVLPTTTPAFRHRPNTRGDARHLPPNAQHANHGERNELLHRTRRSELPILSKRSAAS